MMKRLSHKDLLLLLGIAVAAIIALTTLVYSEHPSEASSPLPTPRRTSVLTSPVSVVKKFLEKVVIVRF